MSTSVPPASAPSNVGPDGEKIVEMDYYNLLEIPGNADSNAIKKAYRKAAMKFHPDRNPGDATAAAKFQEIAEAYSVLQDPNLRAVYNKQGKSSAVAGAGGEAAMPDPGAMFANMFGGKAFEDWIGEISLGKDVSKAFEMSTSEEEREALAAEAAANIPVTGGASPSTVPTSTISHTTLDTPSTAIPSTPVAAPFVSTSSPEPLFSKGGTTTSTTTDTASALPPSSTPLAPAVSDTKSTAPPRMTPEQRQKLELYDQQRIEEKRERLRNLTEKLRDRIRPFVHASNPGGEGDVETERFAKRIQEQSVDLAMESFGVELCQLIGEIYMRKASSYMRLHRKASSNLLGVPGWWSRVKEKGTTLKEGWSFLSVGLDVRSAMADMERRQASGEALDEEEAAGIEKDLSGKLLLVAWKGSKFELGGILRSVVDAVLTKEDTTVTDKELMNRAKAILLIGAILKSVVADETDSERRELERMVAEANRKRKEKNSGAAKAKKPISTPPI